MWRGPVVGPGRKRKSALVLFREEAFGTWRGKGWVGGRRGGAGREEGAEEEKGGAWFFSRAVTLSFQPPAFAPRVVAIGGVAFWVGGVVEQAW